MVLCFVIYLFGYSLNKSLPSFFKLADAYGVAALVCKGVPRRVYVELELLAWSPVVCSVERVTGSLTKSDFMTAG